MRKIFLIPIFLLILPLVLLILPLVIALERIYIVTEIESYSDIPPDEIYVGSLIFYNITIHNPNNYSVERIDF